MVYTEMKFEWDDNKARRNAAKHGVSFEMATFAFYDLYAIVMDDVEHSQQESRYWLIGNSGNGVLTVVYTVRSVDIVRIISARKATRNERRIYEEERV